MPKYEVEIMQYAERQFKKIDRKHWNKLRDAIVALGEEPRPFGYKKLKGREAFRIRVGDYRVIDEIFDKKLVVQVIEIGHRREIYD
ncbi:type II toxin-antitoxin system RelE family toxin [Runella slithyformis]|uniref:Plasmid stabilization system n=1 Tax=Runella slithyformis (strain ATCC 29530 / DSM 19594 / LMG 11500 / NCIMB 11436 / LSU 4) TaxID=761193 RepID=A0A7U4E7A2_RUNSL|nr:type II toxin-antitoxin system RelE/ParE family toxin [Runella slithyformis]AEI50448.1 plasmid stabilization system [Runella slithyformis DSM 19594]